MGVKLGPCTCKEVIISLHLSSVVLLMIYHNIFVLFSVLQKINFRDYKMSCLFYVTELPISSQIPGSSLYRWERLKALEGGDGEIAQ